ncbi:MAG: PilZ domain-containing protein [Thermodesulfobacteriota bacterium]
MSSLDKRRAPRFESLHLSYVLVDEKGMPVRQGMGRTLNLSRTGICLETNFAIEPQQRLVLAIAIDDEIVEVGGRVAYCLVDEGNRFRTGVDFVGVDEAAGRVLDSFIARFQARQG